MNKPVNISVEQIRQAIFNKLTGEMSTNPTSASNEQFYKACALVVRDLMEERRKAFIAHCNAKGQKQVYYLSMEFLMGTMPRSAAGLVRFRIGNHRMAR